MRTNDSRRAFLVASGAALGATLLACKSKEKESEKEKGEVGATEDMMREHGVLRRALVVYREAAARLRGQPASVSPDVLRTTTELFRAFGEEYHERKLEEEQVFPRVRKAGGPAAALVDVLVAQHDRGRRITEYLLGVCREGKVAAKAADVAGVLDSFARMYEAHAAHEDTVVFPAFRAAVSPKELDELGDKFEELEHAQLGKDGFEDAVRKIAAIEAELGIADLARLTAALPPPS